MRKSWDTVFKDRSLLKKAVTHSSYVKEHDRNGQSNERLEFLGDAFFDAVIGEVAVQELSKRRGRLPFQDKSDAGVREIAGQ